MRTTFKRAILSRRTALFLMGILVLTLFVGVNVPQESELSPHAIDMWRQHHPIASTVVHALTLEHLYSSPMFLMLISLLVLAMTRSLVQVVRSVRAEGKSFTHPTRPTTKIELDLNPIDTKERLRCELADRGYKIELCDGGILTAEKNGFSRWGTVILHGGMIVVIAASMVHFLTEQRGFFQLIEGDSFDGRSEEFLVAEHGAVVGPFHPDIQLHLQAFRPEFYSNGEVRSLESVTTITDASARTQKVISLNQPYQCGPTSIYQSTSFGYTVALQLESDGQSIPAYFNLNMPGQIGQPSVGESDFPTTDLTLKFELFPNSTDHLMDVGDVVLGLTVKNRSGESATAVVRPGESFSVGSARITFVEVRRWSGFIVTEQYAVPFVFGGFVLVLTGLCLIFLLPRKSICILVGKRGGTDRVLIEGYARREKAMFREEVKSMIEAILPRKVIVRVGTELVEF